MSYIVIGITALLASLLTFFSGFGLGTILLPVFGLFFPLPVAIALTAIVHLLNNVFKLVLVGKHINREIAFKFGLPSVIAAFVGAFLLKDLSQPMILMTYTINDTEFYVKLINVILAAVMIFFALYELIPFFKNLSFKKDKLILGGLLSGFFGGFSGHQGALRSAFLIRFNLGKESFIATGVVIAVCVDLARLFIYGITFNLVNLKENSPLLFTSVIAAFAGAYIGSKLIKKVTLGFVQVFVSVFLIAIALLMGAGLITK